MGDPAFLCWPGPHAGDTIDAFLERHKPSANAPPHGEAWYFVRSPVKRRGSGEGGTGDAGVAAGQQILARFGRDMATWPPGMPAARKQAAREAVIAELQAAGMATGETCGKWLLFRASAMVDEAWGLVARGTARGELGCAAKVATTGPSHVICVYCDDFSDEADLRRVLWGLAALGLRSACFKSDLFTLLGLNAGNQYGLKVTLHGHLVKELQDAFKAGAGPPLSPHAPARLRDAAAAAGGSSAAAAAGPQAASVRPEALDPALLAQLPPEVRAILLAGPPPPEEQPEASPSGSGPGPGPSPRGRGGRRSATATPAAAEANPRPRSTADAGPPIEVDVVREQREAFLARLDGNARGSGAGGGPGSSSPLGELNGVPGVGVSTSLSGPGDSAFAATSAAAPKRKLPEPSIASGLCEVIDLLDDD